MNEQPAEHAFFRWLRSLDLQRSSDRWIGGVASGLAARTRLDPILVRGIVLIVIIFSGIGLFLYGAAWALLPGPTGRIHLQEVGRGSWTLGFSGALLLLILGTADWFGPRFWYRDSVDLGGLLIVAIVGGALWFVISRSRRAGRNTEQNNPQDDDATLEDVDLASGAATSSNPYYTPKDYSYTYTPKPPKPIPAPRPKHENLSGAATAIVLGLAVIAGGAILALDVLTTGTTDPVSISAALAAALAIMGVGLVAASFSKRTGGALTGWAILTLIPAMIFGGLSADRTGPWQANVFSSTQTDLRHLSEITEDTSVPINAAFSDTRVTVPGDIPVYLNAASGFAQLEVEAADGTELMEFSGVSAPQKQLITDVTEGPELTLDVNGAFTRLTIIVDGDVDSRDLHDGDDWPWDENEWPWDDEPTSAPGPAHTDASSEATNAIRPVTLMETTR